MKKIHSLLLLFIITGAIKAQSPIKTSVDTTNIKIGEAIQLTIKANVENTDNVIFPNTPMIGAFEVIDHKPIDTILQERKMELIKKYTLIQFDSGKYTIPRLSVWINDKNYQTDFYQINVQNVEVDTLKQPMYDIKENIGESKDTSNIIWYIIGVILCIVAGGLTYLFIKKRQEKNLTQDDLYRTPLEKATKQLQLLDNKKLITSGDIKTYYSELTDVIREYIEEVFEIPAKESTTSEVIQLLLQTIKNKKIKLNKDTVQELKRVLQTADLVKFAKSTPMIHEIEQDRASMESVSKNIDKAMPKFAEEQSERVRWREQRFKKRKQMRIWIPTAVTLTSFIILGVFYLTYDTEKEWKIQWLESNKSLYTQQWVASDYGYPAINISTPEILQRKMTDKNKETQNQQAANFYYINDKTNLTILVNTIAVEEKETDIELLAKRQLEWVEQTYKLKNISNKDQNISQQGHKAIRSYGTFQYINSQKEIEMEYEQYLFVQPSGIQQLWISYPQKDEYGKKIAQKIIESIN